MPDLPPTTPNKPRTPDRRPSAHQRGYDHNHRKRRAYLIQKHPLCQACGVAWSTDLDHIDGNPLNNDEGNHQMLCRPCHQKKTSQQTR